MTRTQNLGRKEKISSASDEISEELSDTAEQSNERQDKLMERSDPSPSYKFYDFLRPRSARTKFTGSNPPTTDLLERLRESRLAEIDRKFENNVQQIFWKSEGSRQNYEAVMDTYQQQNAEIEEFCQEMHQLDKIRREKEDATKHKYERRIRLAQYETQERVLAEERTRASDRRQARKYRQEQNRIEDRVSDSSFSVRYTASALQKGMTLSEIETELRLRARRETSTRNKYDEHMIRQLETRGKQLSTTTASYKRLHFWTVKPETLDVFNLPWEWENEESDYIIVSAPVSRELQLELQEHTWNLIIQDAQAAEDAKSRSTEEVLRRRRRGGKEKLGGFRPTEQMRRRRDSSPPPRSGDPQSIPGRPRANRTRETMERRVGRRKEAKEEERCREKADNFNDNTLYPQTSFQPELHIVPLYPGDAPFPLPPPSLSPSAESLDDEDEQSRLKKDRKSEKGKVKAKGARFASDEWVQTRGVPVSLRTLQAQNALR
jgi:hypothetical protein